MNITLYGLSLIHIYEDGNTDSNEDFSLGDYSNEDDIPDYKLQEHNLSLIHI